MPKSDGQIYEACGQALAQETARLLGKPGTVVILTPNTGPSPSPVHARYLSSFNTHLKKQPGLSVAATEKITPSEEGCPAAAFVAVLKKHPTADAVVSFVGPPVLQGADFKTLPARRPKLVVLGGGPALTRTLMARKVLDVSFLPRRHSKSAEAAPPAQARTPFEDLYQLVTPATVATWTAKGSP